jgi:hypothetical protein
MTFAPIEVDRQTGTRGGKRKLVVRVQSLLRRVLGALLLLVLLVGDLPAEQLRALTIHLRARVRSFSVDADIWAGGSWKMRTTTGPDGQVTFSLVDSLLSPWRFYWVDPAGPFGELAWGGTVGFLPPHGPGVREGVDSAAMQFIQGVYQDWRSQGGDFRLDGNDSFYVFGDPADRFRFAVLPDGRQAGPVTNLLTHQWVSDGVARWEAGAPVPGYGFGQVMSEPPESYEPHLYHALVEAVRLLRLSVMAGDSPEQTAALGAGADYTRPLGSAPKGAFGVLKTLVPQVAKTVSPREDLSFAHRVVAVDAGTLRVAADTGSGVSMGDSVKGRVRRETRYDRTQGHVVADALEFDLKRGGSAQSLVLRIGYGPLAGN